MIKYRKFRKATVVSLFALTIVASACSSDDDDDDSSGIDNMITDVDPGGEGEGDGDGEDDSSMLNADLSTVSVLLDSSQSVPAPTLAEGVTPTGEGSFSVDTNTGAVSGTVTVTGTSGPPTVAHIHLGAPGEAGEVLIPLESTSDDNSTWAVAEGQAFDAAGIEAFEAGDTYINVHTDANMAGELRAQIVDTSIAGPGSVTITFTNNAEFQTMTPPVVALHNAPDADNGIRLFEVGQPASPEVVAIAENGTNDGLVAVATGQIDAGTVTAAGVAFVDPNAPGPIFPGQTASVTLDLESDDQVLSVVSMLICTNDGFSGIDSRPLSADASETFNAPVYDAGSEANIEDVTYWVPPCGGNDTNIAGTENGAITLHPGQSGGVEFMFGANPDLRNADFPANSEFLEITVTRN